MCHRSPTGHLRDSGPTCYIGFSFCFGHGQVRARSGEKTDVEENTPSQRPSQRGSPLVPGMNSSTRGTRSSKHWVPVSWVRGGAISHLSAKQGSLRLCTRLTRCKMHLYHCAYVYTIITAVNWRQNGQSSQRDYLTLARRWRPSRSRLSFSPLLYYNALRAPSFLNTPSPLHSSFSPSGVFCTNLNDT